MLLRAKGCRCALETRNAESHELEQVGALVSSPDSTALLRPFKDKWTLQTCSLPRDARTDARPQCRSTLLKP